MTTRLPLRILIADDHAVVREGMRLMIEREPGWEVCGVAADGRAAVEEAIRLRPDVVVLDLHMPELNGLQAVCELKKQVPSVELVIFSGESSERRIEELFAAGARSFIRKVDAGTLLIEAIKSAAQHKPFFTPATSAVLFSRFMTNGRPDDVGARLTSRECQIVRLVADGKSNKEAAAILGISMRTAETHRATVMRKLGVSSVAGLIKYALRNGLVES